MRVLRLLGFLGLLFLVTPSLLAATFTVNTNADAADDNTADGVCHTAAGECSLRAAIMQANAASSPGADVVNFTAAVTTIALTSPLPSISEALTIDATATGYPPYVRAVTMVQLDGTGAGGSDGLSTTGLADNCTIKGLVIRNFNGNGISIGTNGNTIEANFIGTDVTGLLDRGNGQDGISVDTSGNIIGGNSPLTGNVISGNGNFGINMFSVNAFFNVIAFNMIGVDVLGQGQIRNDRDGINISSTNGDINVPAQVNTIGPSNVISGNGNVLGKGISLNSAKGNLIIANFIGTNLAGTTAIANAEDGIYLNGSSGNLIGGIIVDNRNIISGNGEDGIQITGGSTNNVVQGNFIGTDIVGATAIPNARHGIFLNGDSNTISGILTAPQHISGNTGDGIRVALSSNNTITGNNIGENITGGPLGNGGTGIGVGGGGTGNLISQNDISSSGALGIDLFGAAPDGVTANDALDPDVGSNNLQNFPVLTGAITTGATTTVTGTFNSLPNTSFTVEFFSSAAGSCDATGFGEGQDYDSSITVNTDAGGNGSFSHAMANNLAVGAIVTTTATEGAAANNTSEFSNCVTVLAATADLALTKTDAPDPVVAGTNLTYTLTVSNAGPQAADNVALADTLPAGTTFVSLVSPAGYACTTPAVGANGPINCTKASVAAAANDVFTLVVKVDPATPNAALIANTASVSSTTSDPVPLNNTSTASTTVSTSADLSATKTDAPDPVTGGTSLTYDIVVANAGPSDAQTVQMTDPLPLNTTFVSVVKPAAFACVTPAVGTNGTVTCTAPTLAAGANAAFTIVAAVVPSAPDGSAITNIATVSSATFDPNAGNDNASTTTIVAASADLALTKTDAPDPVAAGANITYTITLTNAGTSDAQTVSLADTTPANTTFVSITSPPGYACVTPAVGGTGAITCTNATVPAAANDSFTLVLKVDPGTPNATVITNTATVTTATTDPNAANNSASTSTTVTVAPASADLSITKTDAPDPVAAGTNLTYTLVLSNAGPDPATTVSLSDPLPVNLTFVSLAAPAGYACTTPAVGTNGTITCTNPSVASGAADNFTLVVNVTAATPDATMINNTATVTTATADPNPANNTATATTAVAAVADLGVTKTDAPDPVTVGSNITYTIVVTSAGPSDAQAVALSDTTPANTTFQSIVSPAGWACTTPAVGGTGAITCTNPALLPGATDTFTLVLKVDAATPPATVISNTAIVTSTTTDPNAANNSATTTTTAQAAVPVADLSVTKGDAPDPVLSGQQLTYTIVVSNTAGPDTAPATTVSDPLPAGTTFQSCTASVGTCTGPGVGLNGTVTADFGSLAMGSSATLTVVANVTAAGGVLANTATATSGATDPNPANNSATASTNVTPVPTSDLSVTKSDNPDPVVSGQQVTYTIVVSNAVGPDPADTTTVSDPLPPGTTFASCTTSVGTCTGPGVGLNGTVNANLGTLAFGATATVTIVANVTAAGGATLTNTATVTSTTFDPNAANNSATASTAVNAPLNADLSITKTSTPGTATLGDAVTYTLTIHNNGPGDATGVTVTDNLPAGTAFQSASAGCVDVANVVTCTIGSLANGATATASIVVTVNALGTISNTATVSGNEPDPNPGNGSSSVGTAVQAGVPIPASSPLSLTLIAMSLAAAAWFAMKRS